ncbi:MAG: hypothetical protein WBP81_08000 [Solirubrobacteraceae bacterium]
MTGAHDLAASARAVSFLNCPRCGLSIRPKTSWLTIEHCPRCIARARIPIKLFSSPLPTTELYRAGFAPNASATTDQAAGPAARFIAARDGLDARLIDPMKRRLVPDTPTTSKRRKR